MKKIYLLFSVLMASVSSFSQFTEDFETTAGGNSQVAPAGWSTVGTEWKFQNSGSTSPGYGVSGSVDHTTGAGIYAWIDASGGISANELLTPSITFSGSAPHAGFWLLSNNTNDAAQNSIAIEIFDGTNWVSLGSYSGNNADWVKVAFPIPVAIPSPAQFRVVQTGVANGGQTYYNDLLIDDFFVEDYVCFSPFALSIPSVTAFTGDISWGMASGANGYNIEWGVSGYTAGIGQEIGATTSVISSAQATGLTPETTYDVYVQTDCAAGVSVWVGPISFTTLPLCAQPTAVGATVGALDAQITWTAGGIETDWNVEYGPIGFPLGSGTTDATTATSDDILGLTQLTCYHYYVQANCVAVNATSLWVGPLEFCTVATCPEPSGLGSTVISPDSVGISWTAGGIETEWTISYGMPGFVAGSGLSMTTTGAPSDTLTGLMSDMEYEYYVQANCGAGDASIWVGPMTFTTSISCAEVTALTMTGVTIDSAYIMWTAGGVEMSWNVEYGMDGFTQGTGTMSFETTTDIAIGNLTSGTDYDFYVQAICGAGDSAQWVGPFNFTTVISCAQPTFLEAINISNSSANLIFQAGGSETEWNIEWGVPGFVVGNGEEFGMVANTTNDPYYATGLNPSSTYEFYVQAACGAGDLSVWSGPFTFNTLLANDLVCNAIDLPTDGTVGSYNNINATLNGDAVLTPTSGWSGDAVVEAPVWFSFVAPASGNVTVSTVNDVTSANNSRTEIAIYSTNDCGNFGTYALLGVNGDSPSGFGSEVSACGLITGTTYYVMVDGYSFVDLFSTISAFQGTFGISVDAVNAVEAGNALTDNICTNDANEIFDAIEGYSHDNGTWYFPSATDAAAQAFASNAGSLVLTGLDAGVTYTFDYVVSIGCASDTVSTTYTWSPQPTAGLDGDVASCVNSQVLLIQELSGSVTFGGTWSDDDNVGGLVNGVVDPANIVAGTYNFSYVVEEGTCSDTAVVAVTIDECLGVDANEVSALEVYPNPVADVLTIANLNIEGNATITLLNVQGKVVYTKTISNVNGNYELDLSKFENGIYVVEVISELNTQNVRVVKH
jgi:hypothetical protein